MGNKLPKEVISQCDGYGANGPQPLNKIEVACRAGTPEKQCKLFVEQTCTDLATLYNGPAGVARDLITRLEAQNQARIRIEYTPNDKNVTYPRGEASYYDPKLKAMVQYPPNTIPVLYNPAATQNAVDGDRDPYVGLGQELVRAWHLARGMYPEKAGTDFIKTCMVLGQGPYGVNMPISDRLIRAEFNQAPRTTYPQSAPNGCSDAAKLADMRALYMSPEFIEDWNVLKDAIAGKPPGTTLTADRTSHCTGYGVGNLQKIGVLCRAGMDESYCASFQRMICSDLKTIYEAPNNHGRTLIQRLEAQPKNITIVLNDSETNEAIPARSVGNTAGTFYDAFSRQNLQYPTDAITVKFNPTSMTTPTDGERPPFISLAHEVRTYTSRARALMHAWHWAYGMYPPKAEGDSSFVKECMVLGRGPFAANMDVSERHLRADVGLPERHFHGKSVPKPDGCNDVALLARMAASGWAPWAPPPPPPPPQVRTQLDDDAASVVVPYSADPAEVDAADLADAFGGDEGGAAGDLIEGAAAGAAEDAAAFEACPCCGAAAGACAVGGGEAHAGHML
eukprot:tig00020629_g12443.t1